MEFRSEHQRGNRPESAAIAASIGKFVSPAQGVAHFERDGYYTKDHPVHREASDWTGKSAGSLGPAGPVDPDTFTAILEGKVPGCVQLGRRDKDGNIHHRPGRVVSLSAPKSVSLIASLVSGDRLLSLAVGVGFKPR